MTKQIRDAFHIACEPDKVMDALTDDDHSQKWWTRDFSKNPRNCINEWVGIEVWQRELPRRKRPEAFFLDTPILFSYILLGKSKSVSITSGHFVMSPKKTPRMPESSRMCHAPH